MSDTELASAASHDAALLNQWWEIRHTASFSFSLSEYELASFHGLNLGEVECAERRFTALRKELRRRRLPIPDLASTRAARAFNRDRLPHIATLAFSDGYAWHNESNSAALTFHEDTVEVSCVSEGPTGFGYDEEPRSETYTLPRSDVYKYLQRLKFGTWHHDYSLPITDGGGWGLVITFTDGSEPFERGGYATGPAEFWRLLRRFVTSRP